MNDQGSRHKIIKKTDPRDPYVQYLKYGSRFLIRDGSDGEELGFYLNILLTEPDEEEYRQCWDNFREKGDDFSREKLICWNIRTVYTVARCLVHYPLQNMEIGDLMGYGCLGLMEALDLFDEEEGKEFSNFAFFRISSRMWEGMEDFGIHRAQYQKRKREKELGELEKTRNKSRIEPRGVASSKTVVWEEETVLRMTLQEEMEKLEKREAEVLEQICLEGKSQKKTAKILDLSLYEIRKCQKNALEKLKNYLESP